MDGKEKWSKEQNTMLPVRVEITTSGLWDRRSTNYAKGAKLIILHDSKSCQYHQICHNMYAYTVTTLHTCTNNTSKYSKNNQSKTVTYIQKHQHFTHSTQTIHIYTSIKTIHTWQQYSHAFTIPYTSHNMPL